MSYKKRYCKTCSKEIRKPSWLSIPRYKTRFYCSRPCYAKWMRTNKQGWWGSGRLDFRNRKLTKDDLSAISALVEFDYVKKEDILLPDNID